jgi:hypothetical protein
MMQSFYDQPTTVRRAARPPCTVATAHAAPQSVVDAIRDPGEPLAPAVQSHWESRLGQDLSRIRVHGGAQAAHAADAINASAFTVGRHVAFAAGHGVASDNGRLLGHELAHAVQQGLADVPNRGLVVGPLGGPAEEAARRAGAGGHADSRPGGAQTNALREQLYEPTRRGSSAPLVQREERTAGKGGDTTTTTKKQQSVKIEGTIPAAELQKHAADLASGGPEAKPATAPPGNAGQSGVPAPAPQRPGGTSPVAAPSKTQPPSSTTAELGRPATPATPTPAVSAPTDDHRFFKGGTGLGIDAQAQPAANLAVHDLFDPNHPSTDRTNAKWRPGLNPQGGDYQVPFNIVLVYREARIKGGERVNFGYEPQLVITPLGLTTHQGGAHFNPGVAGAIDLLHAKVRENWDLHIVQAQFPILQGDIDMSGHDPVKFGLGGQLGTGAEYDKNEWLTLGAGLAGQALLTPSGVSYSLMLSVSITIHIKK